MKGRRFFLVPVAFWIAVIAPFAPARADDPPGTTVLTDTAGDANGLDYVVSLDTRPLSYGPADLTEGRLQTLYEATPVGVDGVDYRATGLRIRWRTSEAPVSDSYSLDYQMDGRIETCAATVSVYERGPKSPQSDPPSGTAEWHPYGGQSECPDPFGYYTESAWTATVDTAASSIVLTIPFNSLTPPQAALFSEGTTISGSDMYVWILDPTGRDRLDSMLEGQDFVIGSDMPNDVPCTSGCP